MSRLPLEQMIASLRSVWASPNDGTTGWVSVTVMSLSFTRASHAAVRLGEPRDVGELLGRLLGEQLEQGLGRDPADDADAAQGRGLALLRVVLAQEVDRLPVLVGELDPDLRGERLRQGLA